MYSLPSVPHKGRFVLDHNGLAWHDHEPSEPRIEAHNDLDQEELIHLAVTALMLAVRKDAALVKEN